MTAGEPALPERPQIRPVGPLIPASELGIWYDAAQTRALAERYLQQVRNWARNAYQREQARGHSEGLKTGSDEMARLVTRAASELARRKAVLEQELPQLVIEILNDLVGSFDPGAMLVRTVRHAIEQRYGSAELCLHVSPVNVDALIREFAPFDGTHGRPKVRIDPDPALTPDQCVLWSEFGNVDLGLAAQLRTLHLALAPPSQEGDP
ncbi:MULTISPECIES: type III secretion system stator protein SctL [Bradyrhizobium]|uniref:type III secretion system stator protein SctL n=1 Tax=Bradyrhizobium TaxID=374 RepID=UPI000FE2CD15|nr:MULTISPECIES: type III secretion system stator protein SctL [Bradyrhizobium]TGN74208.1 HrpE/YscL family type III secretion apparatus protein [Bradyrhizobium yuanmingense]UWU68062.1 type III secretion system stator protein SctL [Bradyrhizobium sp. NC92]